MFKGEIIAHQCSLELVEMPLTAGQPPFIYLLTVILNHFSDLPKAGNNKNNLSIIKRKKEKDDKMSILKPHHNHAINKINAPYNKHKPAAAGKTTVPFWASIACRNS